MFMCRQSSFPDLLTTPTPSTRNSFFPTLQRSKSSAGTIPLNLSIGKGRPRSSPFVSQTQANAGTNKDASLDSLGVKDDERREMALKAKGQEKRIPPPICTTPLRRDQSDCNEDNRGHKVDLETTIPLPSPLSAPSHRSDFTNLPTSTSTTASPQPKKSIKNNDNISLSNHQNNPSSSRLPRSGSSTRLPQPKSMMPLKPSASSPLARKPTIDGTSSTSLSIRLPQPRRNAGGTLLRSSSSSGNLLTTAIGTTAGAAEEDQRVPGKAIGLHRRRLSEGPESLVGQGPGMSSRRSSIQLRERAAPGQGQDRSFSSSESKTLANEAGGRPTNAAKSKARRPVSIMMMPTSGSGSALLGLDAVKENSAVGSELGGVVKIKEEGSTGPAGSAASRRATLDKLSGKETKRSSISGTFSISQTRTKIPLSTSAPSITPPRVPATRIKPTAVALGGAGGGSSPSRLPLPRSVHGISTPSSPNRQIAGGNVGLVNKSSSLRPSQSASSSTFGTPIKGNSTRLASSSSFGGSTPTKSSPLRPSPSSRTPVISNQHLTPSRSMPMPGSIGVSPLARKVHLTPSAARPGVLAHDSPASTEADRSRKSSGASDIDTKLAKSMARHSVVFGGAGRDGEGDSPLSKRLDGRKIGMGLVMMPSVDDLREIAGEFAKTQSPEMVKESVPSRADVKLAQVEAPGDRMKTRVPDEHSLAAEMEHNALIFALEAELSIMAAEKEARSMMIQVWTESVDMLMAGLVADLAMDV